MTVLGHKLNYVLNIFVKRTPGDFGKCFKRIEWLCDYKWNIVNINSNENYKPAISNITSLGDVEPFIRYIRMENV